MPNLKEVKNRISSVQSTQQITKAMKMVAAAKLRRAQDRIIDLRPYASKLNGVLQNVSAGADNEENPFSQERYPEKVLMIVVTSDRGLCGAFNSNIYKATIQHIETNYKSINKRGDLTILPLGRKGYEYFKKRKYTLVDDFWTVFSDLTFEKVGEAAQFAMDSFVKGEFDKIDIVYNEFKNVATQIIRTEQFLPVEVDSNEDASTVEVDYIYQPDQETIFQELLPKSLKVQVFKAVLESNASEQGARMTAMGQATDNAGELLKELRLTYNRTRQAAITTELTEIVAGAQALES